MRCDEIQIPDPCSEDWELMRPQERGRFCARCEKHVHDLSAMTEQDVRELLEGAPDDICVSYLQDARGEVLLQPAIVPMARLSQRRPMAHAALSLALAACAPHAAEPSPQIDIEEPMVVPALTLIPAAPEPGEAPEPCDHPEEAELDPPPVVQNPPERPRPRTVGRIPIRHGGQRIRPPRSVI
jgi:hypothetical protein